MLLFHTSPLFCSWVCQKSSELHPCWCVVADDFMFPCLTKDNLSENFQCGQLAMLGVSSLPHRKTFSFHEPEAPGGVRFKILNLHRLWHLEGFQTELECGNSSERVSIFQDRILELIFKLGPVGNTATEGFRWLLGLV